MSDLNDFVMLLQKHGIDAKIKVESDWRKTIVLRVENKNNDDKVTLSDKISGYVDCYVDIAFNSFEEFQGIGIFKDL